MLFLKQNANKYGLSLRVVKQSHAATTGSNSASTITLDVFILGSKPLIWPSFLRVGPPI